MRHKTTPAPLAIVGMECRLPGAENRTEFWNLLATGGSGIVELPADRLDRQLYYDPRKGQRNKSYSALGGLVASRPLDRNVCPLSEELIATSDVAHLNLCEVAAAACRDAGLDPFDLPLRNAGVFVGHTAASPLASQIAYAAGAAEMAQYLREIEPFRSLGPLDQHELISEVVATVRRDCPRMDPQRPIRLSSHAAAELIARGFSLTGPYLVVDAACASSLQALALGAAALRQGRIDMAIVGGASYCKSDTLVLFSQAQSLSAKGSRPFDAAADGLILAEGYVVLVVKTLERAVTDGDSIQAVIRGIGMATDGRGKSLWAPRKEGQILAIRRAYEPDLDAGALDYIEAHATSTQLGDATELQALAEALEGRLQPGKKIPLGSVKANVGHTLEAAGLAGLAKTLLCLEHAAIPPAIHCTQLNSEIDWSRAPFYLSTTPLPWPEPADRPRRAGINSFGIGGLNVHVVLDGFSPQWSTAPTRRYAPNGRNADADADREAVAIVGAGCILPGARTIEAFGKLLTSGGAGTAPLPPQRWNQAAAVDPRTGETFVGREITGGFITDYAYDWKRHVVPPKQVEQANPVQFMLLDATEDALRDGGFDRKPFDRTRAAVLVGTIFGDEFAQHLNLGLRLPQFERTLADVLQRRGLAADRLDEVGRKFGEVLLKHMPALIDETGSFTSSTLASRISKAFDLQGGALALDAGAASGLAVLAAGVDLLLDGSCEMVVCAAGDRNLGLVNFEAYASEGKLADGTACSPFDQQARGSVPGEGVGVVLLKRLSDARRDGDRIRGILRGIGAAASESIHDTARLAMRRALRDARIEGRQVSAVEMASAGVAAEDVPHVRAVAETLRPVSNDQPLLLSSLTGQLGNTGATAGMAGVIKASLALGDNRLPPNGGLRQAADWLGELSHSVQANAREVALPASAANAGPYIGVTAIAGGHLAYHVILERADRMLLDKGVLPSALTPAWSKLIPQSPIVRFAAQDCEALAAQVQAAAQSSPNGYACDRFETTDRWRLAVVGADAGAIAAKLSLAASQINNPAARGPLEEQGVFLARANPSGKLAFLFPGQGSQTAGMLLPLIDQCPTAAEACREVDAALALLKLPDFRHISTDEDGQLGVDVFRTQLAMLLADILMFRVVSALGITPAVVAGHSFGEFAALVAAGAWSLEQAIGATIERSRAIESIPTDAPSAMLSVAAAEGDVRRVLAELPGVFVSHQNAPDQTVVAGQAGCVQELAARLRAAGFESRPLAVPRPFHTPLMAAAQQPWRRALQQAWISMPRIPLFSSVTNRSAISPEEIRDNLVEQLTAPVRYVDLVRTLARDGVTAFVEIGPQQVLTRLHRRILSDTPCLALAADSPKRTPAELLARLVAQLDCLGMFDQAPTAQAAPQPGASHDRRVQEFINFDATAARRAKKRSEGLSATDDPQDRPVTTSDSDRMPNGDLAMRPSFPAADSYARAAEPTPPAAANAISPPSGRRTPKVAVRARAGAPKSEDLERFLVNFVIEQTGYPAEIVRLDADLEADLGIDSIKKAQLFGELAEFYEVTTPENLRLDNFPTLRHVLEFLQTSDTDLEPSESRAAAAPATVELPRPNHPSAATLAAEPRVADSRPAPVASPAALVSPSQPAYSVPAARGTVTIRARANAPQLAELEQFLVNFVIEQTGYPPEIVRLDADLEADLGIDSIKKAQLFGELAEFYEVSTPENLRLDDFPTLQCVLDLLKGSSMPAAAEPPAVEAPPPAEPPRSPADLPIFDGVVRLLAGLLEGAADEGLSIAAREATAFEIGRRYGEHQRSQLRAVLKRFAESWDGDALLKSVNLSDASVGPKLFGPLPWEQLQGVAAGVGVHVGGILAAYQRAGGGLAPTADAPGDSAATTQRLVLRMVDAPPATISGATFVPRGGAFILGDNGVSRALKARLTAQGLDVVVVSDETPSDAVIEQLGRLWARCPVAHLFLTTSHDPAARQCQGEAAWNRRREHGVLNSFRLCQEWIGRVSEARLADVATLVAVTALGGDFGLAGRVAAVEGGALAGLTKSIYIDSLYEPWKGVRCQVYDFSSDEAPDDVATLTCQELERCESNLEIGFRDGQRRVLRAVLQDAPGPASHAEPRGLWVVTGGGRGVTALAAIELAKRYGLKLHLLGTAPRPDVDPSWRNLSPEGLAQLKTSILREAAVRALPPLEAWSKVDKAIQIDATLRCCAAGGVQATYHCCDVSDRARLADVLGEIRAVDGPIDGILHGAAIVRDGAFERKKLANVRATLAAKNDAAAALLELTRDDPLRHFIAFTSMSGRFGFRGQSDYAAANEWLAKQVDSFRSGRPQCRSVAIHWHAWDGVGLAAREELQATFAAMAVKFMPRAEAIGHLLREIEAGLPEPEVLFTDAQFLKDQYPLPVIATDTEAATTPASVETPRGPVASQGSALPLVSQLRRGAQGESLVAQVTLDPRHDPFLNQHLLNGRPLMPMVIGMECLAEAAQALGPGEVVGLQQIEITKGLPFPHDGLAHLEIAASRAHDGCCPCRLTSTPDERERKPGEAARLHLSANITLGQRRALPGDDFPGEPPLGWFPLVYPQDAPIYHGPLWRALTHVAFQYDGAFGRVTAPDVRLLGGTRVGTAWVLPAVALDACFYACGSFLYSMFGRQIDIPRGIEQLRLGRLPEPGEQCIVRILFREQQRRGSRFDFRLYGANRDCLLEVQGYRTMVIVRGTAT